MVKKKIYICNKCWKKLKGNRNKEIIILNEEESGNKSKKVKKLNKKIEKLEKKLGRITTKYMKEEDKKFRHDQSY